MDAPDRPGSYPQQNCDAGKIWNRQAMIRIYRTDQVYLYAGGDTTCSPAGRDLLHNVSQSTILQTNTVRKLNPNKRRTVHGDESVRFIKTATVRRNTEAIDEIIIGSDR